MPSTLDQLKQKYQPVIDVIQREGGQLQNINMDGNQLYIKAIMPSEDSKNRVWDVIKSVDPKFSDLKHDIEVLSAGGASQATQSMGGQEKRYTVQPGDNLSKISQRFYGDASKYMTIARANNLKDPDKIQAGQELLIPAA
jgi:nucleoid-associated protein YgaU